MYAPKKGGIDPDGNLALRSLIDRAKKDQVPTHVIEKSHRQKPRVAVVKTLIQPATKATDLVAP